MEAFDPIRREASELHHRQVTAGVDALDPMALATAALGELEIDLAWLPPDDPALKGAKALFDEQSGTICCAAAGDAAARALLLAHEIGHFLIPTHRMQRDKFLCEPVDMRRLRGGNFSERPAVERIEVEANEFAAALLVPAAEFKLERKALGSTCDVAHIRQLAETFDVSQEVMAKIYVMAADEKAAIIASHNGVVKRVIPQQGFPFLGLRKDSLIPPEALTRSFSLTAANDPISALQEVPIHAWLEKRGVVSALYEQVFMQEDGWVMTMLLVDEDDGDEDADDRNWNRRNARI